MRIFRFLPILLLAAVLPAADLTVGSATARAGQRANGYLHVPAGADAAVEIPVIVINGANTGPTLALVAGAHGTEYASILALEKLAQTVNAAELSGALIVVPLLNQASFTQKVPHLNPVDGKGMNRLYPGKADGTQTERALLAITKEVVEKCDYLLDYHGGDLDENLRRYSYWPDTGNERLDAATRGMVLAFGLDHIIIQNNRTPVQPGGAVTLTRYTLGRGKPAIAVEAGHAGTTNAEDIEVLVDGTFAVMRHLKMLPGEARPVANPLWIGRYSVLASEREGIFYPLVGPEAYVTKGMKIGYVTDYFGNTIWEAASPVSGVILYIGALPSMKKGDNVAYIGEVSEGAH
jgi:predicted deacylase